MMADLRGAVVLVTGASRGVGRHLARAMAQDGARVILVARSTAALASSIEELSAIGPPPIPIAADLRDRTAPAALIDEVERTVGPIDVLINNAGVQYLGPLAVQTPEQIAETIQINLGAAVALTRAVLPGMLQRGRGHVVQVASIGGKMPAPYAATYAATKYALVGLTHSLQAELASTGVGVSVVCPGMVAGEGMWARLASRPHPVLGECSADQVVRAVRRLIRTGDVEQVVNPMPHWWAIALWGLAPTWAARLFRMVGGDEYARRVTSPRDDNQ